MGDLGFNFFSDTLTGQSFTHSASQPGIVGNQTVVLNVGLNGASAPQALASTAVNANLLGPATTLQRFPSGPVLEALVVKKDFKEGRNIVIDLGEPTAAAAKLRKMTTLRSFVTMPAFVLPWQRDGNYNPGSLFSYTAATLSAVYTTSVMEIAREAMGKQLDPQALPDLYQQPLEFEISRFETNFSQWTGAKGVYEAVPYVENSAGTDAQRQVRALSTPHRRLIGTPPCKTYVIWSIYPPELMWDDTIVNHDLGREITERTLGRIRKLFADGKVASSTRWNGMVNPTSFSSGELREKIDEQHLEVVLQQSKAVLYWEKYVPSAYQVDSTDTRGSLSQEPDWRRISRSSDPSRQPCKFAGTHLYRTIVMVPLNQKQELCPISEAAGNNVNGAMDMSVSRDLQNITVPYAAKKDEGGIFNFPALCRELGYGYDTVNGAVVLPGSTPLVEIEYLGAPEIMAAMFLDTTIDIKARALSSGTVAQYALLQNQLAIKYVHQAKIPVRLTKLTESTPSGIDCTPTTPMAR